MRKFVFSLSLLLALGWAPPGYGQSLAKTFTLNAASQNACIGTNGLPTVGIDISGTSSLTLQPQVSINGSAPKTSNVRSTVAGSAAQPTIITSGSTSASYVAAVGGFDTFCLNVSAYTSGAATIQLNPSPAVNAGLFANPGTVTSVSGTANQIDVATGTTTPVISLDPTVQTGSGRSSAPTGTGQAAANQLWLASGVLTTTPSFATTGGSINCAHNVTLRIALNTAAGLTLASASLAGSDASFGCSGGTSGVITIPAPTLPSGFLGASFYVFDSSSGSGVGNEVLQASCTNIVTSCVLTSINNTGAAPLTTPTAYLNPANLQATECPPGVIASVFSVDDSGNYRTYEGVDLYSNNGRTAGTPTICHATAFTDQGVEPVVGNNAFVVIDHTAGVNTSASNQDRALWVNHANPASDTATRYGLEAIQAEMDLNGAPTAINGSPDGEVTSGSFQVADNHTNAIASPNGYAGVMAGRFSASRSSTGTWSSCHGTLGVCMAGVYSQAFQNNSATYGNSFIAGVMGYVFDQSAGTTTGGVSLYGLAPGSTLATGYTEYLENAGAYGPSHFNANQISASDSTGIQGLNLLHGPIAVGVAGAAGPIATYAVRTNGTMAINTLTKLTTDSPVQGAKLATNDLASAVFGICTVYCAGGSGTNAVIALAGVTPCVFDNATTADDYVGVSTGTAGDCTDLGTAPTVDTIGRAQTTNGSPGTSNVVLSLHQPPVVQANLFRTTTNCSVNSVSPAACGAAAAGAVVIPTTTTTYTVNTTAVTSHSRIELTWLTFASDLPSTPTCTVPTLTTLPTISNVVAATSFTVTMTSTVGQTCLMFTIEN